MNASRFSTIFMHTIRLEILHTSVVFKLKSSIPASNTKLNRCYYFLQVTHSERMTCQIAVSIWSPHSWTGKRWHSGPCLLKLEARLEEDQRALSTTAPNPHLPADFKPCVSRSDMESTGQLSTLSQLCHTWWHLKQTSVLPTFKKKSSPLWYLLKGIRMPHSYKFI